MATSTKKLAGKICLVAGATRGAGRGIATMLGDAGATVYCTGRSSRAARVTRPAGAPPFELEGRPETIEETAELVTRRGGEGIAVRVDHTVPAEVAALMDRIGREQGRLDLLVNDVWGGDALAEWGKPFWEQSLEKGLAMHRNAVTSHIITSQRAIPLMLPLKQGLVIEITDGLNDHYRGNFFYDLVKSTGIRMALAMAQELRPHRIAALALTPGFLRSEAMLEHFGVTEERWRDGAAKDPHFIASETPCFVGRAVVALACDPAVLAKSGGVYSSWGLSEEYGFTDIDGNRPNWGRYFAEHVAPLLGGGA